VPLLGYRVRLWGEEMIGPPSGTSLKMIQEDCWWAVDTGLAAQQLSGLEISTLGFCLFQHWARIVYESHRYLSAHDPDLGQQLTLEFAPQIEAARHSVKLFDDTRRGYVGLTSWFDQVLVPAHRKAFTGKARWKWARRFETDLGLYTLGDRLVTTTQVATYHAGIDPAIIPDPAALSAAFFDTAHNLGLVLGAIVRGLRKPPRSNSESDSYQRYLGSQLPD
jgi:hypothetical protein